MRRIFTTNIYIKDTGTEKGRGVFAARDFAIGEIIEECPVILFENPFYPPSDIKRVLFSWLALTKAASSHAYALALGFGSMYNHDNPSNMRYEADTQNITIKFISVRDIGIGEELTINYNSLAGGTDSNENTWFERMNVRPITNT